MAYGDVRRGGPAAPAAWVLAGTVIFAGCGLETSGDSPDLLDATADVVRGPDAAHDARLEVSGDANGSADGDEPDAIADGASPDGASDASDAGSAPDAHDASDAKDACAPVETNCLDGIDDDCNGLTDCADPACAVGFRCVAPPPVGWTGYAVYQDARVACAAAFPSAIDTFESLNVAAPKCTACDCVASGVSCAGGAGGTAATATLSCGAVATCLTAPTTTASVTSTCGALAATLALTPLDGCNVAPPAPVGGACALTPGGGAPDNVAGAFAKLTRVCGGAGAGLGCPGSQVCIPKVPAATHGACVSRAVANGAPVPACPSVFPKAHTTAPTATSFDDTRTCTACQCGAKPTGAKCAARVKLYSATDCTATDGTDVNDAGLAGDPGDAGEAGVSDASDAGAIEPIAIDSDGTCHGPLVSAPMKLASAVATFSVASQGTCAKSGGAPQGALAAKDQTAYCCEN